MRATITLIAVTFAVDAFGQQPPPKRIEAAVVAEMARQKIPGAAVAVLRGDAVVIAQGFGFANLEHRVPVTPETMFQSGSVGKQLTAAGIMLLEAEGKIAVDDPVTKYLPEAPASWSGITLRHLLTHTSGIPDYTPETIDFRRDYTEDELAELAFRLKREFPPGARWNYSNTGYVLLGIIMRKVTGAFYGDYLRARLFEPAGMRTARIISEEEIVPHRAAGYRLVDGEVRNQEWVAPKLNTTADGSLYVSLNDMIAWGRAVRARNVVPAALWDQMHTPVRLASGNSYPYGFGWSLTPVNGTPRIHHGGAWQGFKAYICRYPDADLTIIALMNLADAEPERLVDAIARAIDERLVERALTPIADDDPALTARVQRILAAAREGRLDPAEMAYVRAGFFPHRADAYRKHLQDAGEGRLVLMQRRALGDDVVHVYDYYGASKTLRVTAALAPDGKVADLRIQPQPRAEAER